MRWFILGLILSSFGGAACGKSPTGPDINGNFRLMLKDSPFSDAKSVLVTFTGVSAHRSGDGSFTTIGAGTRTCDLKKLQTSQDVLGAGTIQNGYYTQLRLVVSSAVIYFDNAAAGSACAASIAAPAGRSAAVDIPSGEIKLNYEFNVPATGSTTMVIDFDGDRSIHVTGEGRYIMTPVIEIVSVQ
jgi:hypothetical protein